MIMNCSQRGEEIWCAANSRASTAHIEARCYRRVAIKLDPRQIVKGVAAFPNQFDDSLEPAFAAGDLDGRSRSQTESAETSDKCEIKILVVTVVRDVEESRFLPSALGHRASFTL